MSGPCFFLECLIIGKTYNCNCSKGYIWSNEVCNAHQCCNEMPCLKNLSGVTPLCVAKVEGKNLPVCLGCCLPAYPFNGVIIFLYQFASVDRLNWGAASSHTTLHFMTLSYAATDFQIHAFICLKINLLYVCLRFNILFLFPKLQSAFQNLNGFKFLNVTGFRYLFKKKKNLYVIYKFCFLCLCPTIFNVSVTFPYRSNIW